MFWRFAMLRFTTLLAHDHQKQDSCLGRKSLNVTNVPLCTADDGIFFVNLFIRLNFVLLERCFFFSKKQHICQNYHYYSFSQKDTLCHEYLCQDSAA